MLLLLAALIGLIAGLRAFTAPAAVCLAARYCHLGLADTPLAFLGFVAMSYILTVFAIGELINDKLPKTPSRKTLVSFVLRIAMGDLCGAALGAPGDALVQGGLAGALGGVAARLAATNFGAVW